MQVGMELDRRQLVAIGLTGLMVDPRPLTAATHQRGAHEALPTLEAEVGGRLGVAAWDTGSGAWLRWRANERFAMCSTFKLLLAAMVLDRVDHGGLAAGQRVALTGADLLGHSPVTSAHVAEGVLSVRDLCAAVIVESDNGAANLLLRLIGGPPALTRHLRRLGDPVTRLDRTEMALNANLPGDVRDTTTPEAYVRTMRRVLLGDGLSPASRQQLEDWMIDCRTGLDRLRAGMPAGWKAGDKTGTGDNGAVNDAAIVRPPGRAPFLIAVFLSGSSRTVEELSATHARVARSVIAALA